MDTNTKNYYKEGNGGERVDYDRDDNIASTKGLVLGFVGRYVKASISRLSWELT